MSQLPSGQSRYPSHRWGPFADDPALDVGITGQALAVAVYTVWLNAGGTEETFADVFPHLAGYTLRQAMPI